MTYEGALLYLSSLGEVRIRPGLSRIRKALLRLGSPQKEFACVLVGGTNGKGSTSAFLSSIMTSAGHRVGLYTSPHLVQFEERIRIGDQLLPREELPPLVQRVRGAAADLSYFEFATAMAMVYFAQEKVDLAVLEVGLGGRWDATNAVDPLVSVITTIALDHLNWLGPTMAHVAREKAKIFRSHRPAVIGAVSGKALDVLRTEAERKAAHRLLFGSDFVLQPDEGLLTYRGPRRTIGRIRLGLNGPFQVANAACALAVAEALGDDGLAAGDRAVQQGLSRVVWPGRFQVLDRKPAVILDCAHNPAAMEALVQALGPGSGPTAWVFSSLRDKDAAGMARGMASLGGKVFLVELDNPRAGLMPDLLAAFRGTGMDAEPSLTLVQALESAAAAAGSGGRVVIAGSSYLAGAALDHFRRTERPGDAKV